MTTPLLRNFFCLLSIAATLSCKSKSLVGHWKIDQLAFIHHKIEDRININNKDSLFTILQSGWGKKYTSKQIDSIVYLIQHSFLTLNSDHTFKLVDAGSLLRGPDGFLLKGRVGGKWEYSQNSSILKLNLDSGYRRYKVLNLDDSSILLNELFEETKSPVTKVKLIRQ